MFYQDENGNTIDELKVNIGIYSPKIFLKRENDDKSFSKSFTLKSITEGVQTEPPIISVTVGTEEKYFRVYSEEVFGK